MQSLDIEHVMNAVTDRAKSYLLDEVEIQVSDISYLLHDVHTLELKYLTSLMSIGGNYNIYMAFSFDESLIRHITEVYTSDIEVEEDEAEIYLEETAGDVINIILGNATADLASGGTIIQLSPPVVITEAKSIARSRGAKFYTANMDSSYGRLSVFIIGPTELFDTNLTYKQD